MGFFVVRSEMMDKCPHCHAPMPDKAAYCICGYKRPQTAEDIEKLFGGIFRKKENKKAK